MNTDEEKLIYFLCYPQKDMTRITVIDLHPCVSYERDEWANVNDDTYYTPEEAISAGRALATKMGATYELFESRYNSSTSEEENQKRDLLNLSVEDKELIEFGLEKALESYESDIEIAEKYNGDSSAMRFEQNKIRSLLNRIR